MSVYISYFFFFFFFFFFKYPPGPAHRKSAKGKKMDYSHYSFPYDGGGDGKRLVDCTIEQHRPCPNFGAAQRLALPKITLPCAGYQI
jgi:hypothetical protein